MAALMAAARKKEGGEILLQDIARANLQQRFEESVERIKQIFTEMAAGPLTKVLNFIAKVLENTTLLKGILIGAAALFGVIAALAIKTAIAVTVASGGTNLLGAALIGGATAVGATMLGMSTLSGGLEDTDSVSTTPGPGQPPTPYQSNNPTSNPYSTNKAQDMQREQVHVSMSRDLQTRITNLEQHQVYSERTQNLEAQMSDTELKRSKAYTQSVMSTSPKPAEMAQVPYSTAPYSGREDLEEYKKSIGSADTPKKSVIQNNISLVVDGKQMATVLNMIPSDIA
jgi:hypothetical protein